MPRPQLRPELTLTGTRISSWWMELGWDQDRTFPLLPRRVGVRKLWFQWDRIFLSREGHCPKPVPLHPLISKNEMMLNSFFNEPLPSYSNTHTASAAVFVFSPLIGLPSGWINCNFVFAVFKFCLGWQATIVQYVLSCCWNSWEDSEGPQARWGASSPCTVAKKSQLSLIWATGRNDK